jgi:hypothetical protein
VLTSSCAETKDSGDDVMVVLVSPWRRVELSVRNNTDRCNETKVRMQVLHAGVHFVVLVTDEFFPELIRNKLLKACLHCRACYTAWNNGKKM